MDGRLMLEDEERDQPFAGRMQRKPTKEDRKVLAKLHRMLNKAKGPDKRYRKRADEGVDFFFGDQWDPKDRKDLEDRDQPVITVNRVKPTVKLVHGLAVSQPLDWLAKPVGANDDALSEMGTAALKAIASQNDTTDLINLCYFDALTYGVGWMMVGIRIRWDDPRKEPIQHMRIDPREIRLDPNSRERDLSDARFIIWSRKVDLDEAQEEYPDFADELEKLTGLRDPNLADKAGDEESNPGLVDMTPPHSQWDENEEANFADKDDDGDGATRKVILHEVWQRYKRASWMLEYRDGHVCAFDPSTPEGRAKLRDHRVRRAFPDFVYKVKVSTFCGHLLLEEEEDPYDHDDLPFAACWHERDKHGDPVSFVEAIKDMQREINHRRSRMLWEDTNRQLWVDPAVLQRMDMDLDEFTEHAGQAGAVFLAKPGEIGYLTRADMGKGQFTLLQHATNEIQLVSGANNDLMGYDSSSESGKAKQIQMDQGQTMQRGTESNLRAFHRQVGRLTMALIQQVKTEEWVVRLTDKDGREKLITLNQEEVDPVTGQSRVLNDMTSIRYEIVIDVQPWTPTLRQRASELIGQMAANEQDPIVRRGLQKIQLTVADIPERAKVLDLFTNAEQQQLLAQQMMAGGAGPMGPGGPGGPGGMPMGPDGLAQMMGAA